MADIDWQQVRDYYAAGHSREQCQRALGFSDWDWHAAVGRGDVVPRVKGAIRRSSERREVIARLRTEGLSYNAISRRLGVSKATVAYHARRLGVPADDRCGRRYDWHQIQEAVDDGLSMRQCRERFGFSKATWTKAVKRGAIVPREWIIPIEDLLVAGSRRGRAHVKARLINEGLKENRCETCGITEWRGKSLSMELHHVNGDGEDNRLENLQLLCGNCHAQTDNWGGRGIRRQRSESSQQAA
jgi:lambda repressor-like predicted transcriptional regulator